LVKDAECGLDVWHSNILVEGGLRKPEGEVPKRLDTFDKQRRFLRRLCAEPAEVPIPVPNYLGNTNYVMASDVSVLLEISSEAGTSRVPMRGETIRIGRATDNDVVLTAEQTVSRHHAELLCGDEGWMIRDLGSHNGTHVNGVRLKADALIRLAGWMNHSDDNQHDTALDVVTVGAVTLRLLAVDNGDGLTIADTRGSELHRLLTALSERERQVLTLVAQGRTDDQVAGELFISVKTVHSHLDRIRDKTGVRRRAELTRVAVRLGLAPAR
jgi:pSer/pThr/pTyr-binding forkhead associated (FHA) protein